MGETIADEQESGPSISRFDHLQAKYLFRYPFTFTSMKWALVLGSLFGLHSFIRHRSTQYAFQRAVWATTLIVFPIWGFFMTKYTFYQTSIQHFEIEEEEQIDTADQIKRSNINEEIFGEKRYMQYKLKAHNIDDPEQLSKMYEKYLRRNFERNCLLDEYLVGVTKDSY